MRITGQIDTGRAVQEQHKQIIILNGPPGCGKDTLAEQVLGRSEHVLRFKDSLYDLTYHHFGVGNHCKYEYFVDTMCNDRVLKETPTKLLEKEGKWFSPREALIETSENVAKPLFGKGVFGQALAERINKRDNFINIISDGGFKEEMEELRHLGYKVKIIQLHGRGSFDNDSRDYVEIDDDVYTTMRIMLREGEIAEGKESLIKAIKEVPAVMSHW
jgi:hypothetical protein